MVPNLLDFNPLAILRKESIIYSDEDFAKDFVSILAMEFASSRNPVNKYGFPLTHRISQSIYAMGEAAKILSRNEDYYQSKYEEFACHYKDDDKERLAFFVDYNNIVFRILVDEQKSVADVFSHMVFATRLSFVFREKGMLDAPDLVAESISKAMRRLSAMTDGSIYRMLADYAERVVRNDYQTDGSINTA